MIGCQRLKRPVLFVMALICTITILSLFSSTTVASALSEKEACNVLVEVASNQHLVIENPSGKYYCVSISKSSKYFIFQLHYGGGEPKDWVGSDLAGYYAVSTSDASVLEWDFNNEVTGKVIYSNTQKGN
jgi:hypothetical protein